MYQVKTPSLNPRGQQAQSLLQVSTVRSFEGGLNVTDTDLNMSPKFAKVLDNLERDIDGSNALRPGTVLLTNQIVDATDIINHTYFAGFIISVQASGNITRTAGDGTVFVMTLGNDGVSKPWPSGIEFVDFTIFNSDLIITNGRDKPLIIAGNVTDPNFLIVQLLVDKASGTNVNTPVTKYVIAHGRYTIMAGSSVKPSTIFVSAKDTSGTYVGDGAPNDAVDVDLGPRVSLGSATITGLVAYRDKLLVTFERGVLPVNLGIYEGTPLVHTPTDDGFIEEFGCLSHRSLVSVGDDTFFCDNVGVNSINRVNVLNTLRPVRASHLIDPLITAGFLPLTQAQIERYVFAVYDLRHFRYMLFVPTFDSGGTIIETVCYSYTNIPALKIQAWSRLRGWIWQSACRTALQNIVFSRGNKLYAYDFDTPDANADRRADPAVNGGNGEPVAFEWEMPWADMKHRMDIKVLRYLSLDTTGQAEFNAELYIDNLEFDPNGVRTPYLVFPFTAGNGLGYGRGGYGRVSWGGGRRTSEERLYAFTAKFKLMKLRFVGSTLSKLKFISISVAFLHGSIRR